MLGGYAVTEQETSTGEQKYKAMHHSTSWLNIVYGNKWQGTIYLGYTKNLGVGEKILSPDLVYGRGTDIDQLMATNLGLTYNHRSWSWKAEYSISSAYYGEINTKTGKVINANSAITNHRMYFVAMFLF